MSYLFTTNIDWKTIHAICHILFDWMFHFLPLDSMIQWHIFSGTCVTGSGAVCRCYITAYLFESMRVCSSDRVYNPIIYARRHDVLEHISQHATLAFLQPNCATHLSKCQRSRSRRCLKNPSRHMFRVKNCRQSCVGKPHRNRMLTEEGGNRKQVEISVTRGRKKKKRKNTFQVGTLLLW